MPTSAYHRAGATTPTGPTERLSRALRCAAGLAVAMAPLGAAAGQSPGGAELFQQHCAPCHDHPQERVPGRESLASRDPEDLVQIMTAGVMRNQAIALSRDEKRAIAAFLTGRQPAEDSASTASFNRCAKPEPLQPPHPRSDWNGWGWDLENSRHQSRPGLRARDVPRLKLKWAFGYDSMAYGQPTVVGGRIYVTGVTGRVLSLDASLGCAYWSFDAEASTRTAVTIGRIGRGVDGLAAAFFGDDGAFVYAVDASSGALIWKTRVDTHQAARVTGAPTLYAGRYYVPVSSVEEAMAMNASYPCCTFRGSVVALDAATGTILWKTSAIARAPTAYRVNSAGTQMLGPAGAAIWSAPTIDAQRRLLYVGTGNSYTDVGADTADSVLALDLESGRVVWSKQLGSADNFVVGCSVVAENNCIPGPGLECHGPGVGNCPTTLGRDFDFGGSPMLRTDRRRGASLLIAAQKSGWVYALDAAHSGATVWRARVGEGSALGGVEWGPSADSNAVFVANSDILPLDGATAGGLTALSIRGGAKLWFTPSPRPPCSWTGPGCSAAQSQAVTSIPGAVFSGAVDGHLRAYSSRDGRILWDFDTAREFPSVNGVKTVGGSLNHGGPVVVNGVVYVNSGYSPVIGQRGNALLAFSVDGH
jgi:polyvinyl alcohol dehydrogenase (cytochrome)